MNEAVLHFIKQKLAASIEVMLLYVLYSEGSSPGRQGFHMIIAKDEELFGSIGGGIMEHKLVELAKKKLAIKEKMVELKYQYHDKLHPTNQSGMICSGHQTIGFFPLGFEDIVIIEKINQGQLEKENSHLLLSPKGIGLIDPKNPKYQLGFHQKEEMDWYFATKLKEQKVIHIFGGGHVSLALSEVMRFLGFHIKVYDNRPKLNTLQENKFCHEKHIHPFETIDSLLENCEKEYAVIMTFGYRPDKVILLQLLQKKFFYIGLMGSNAKIKTLMEELTAEGFSAETLEHIFTPIGLSINSKTTAEIAISIAAEIIRETNK